MPVLQNEHTPFDVPDPFRFSNCNEIAIEKAPEQLRGPSQFDLVSRSARFFRLTDTNADRNVLGIRRDGQRQAGGGQ